MAVVRESAPLSSGTWPAFRTECYMGVLEALTLHLCFDDTVCQQFF